MPAQSTAPARRQHQETVSQAFQRGLTEGAKVPPQTTALLLLPFIVAFLVFGAWILFRVARFFLRHTH